MLRRVTSLCRPILPVARFSSTTASSSIVPTPRDSKLTTATSPNHPNQQSSFNNENNTPANNTLIPRGLVDESTFAPDAKVIHLKADDPIVQRLFRPHLPSDFVGKPEAAEELRWLRRHAILFGLHPDRDLQLPSLEECLLKPEPPLDQRYAAQLERVRKIREKKEERQLEKSLKQNRIELLRRQKKARKLGLPVVDESADALEEDYEIGEKEALAAQKGGDAMPKERLPLRLLPQDQLRAYKDNNLKTIREIMAGMDDRVAKWKAQRRLQRRERKVTGPFAAQGKKGQQQGAAIAAGKSKTS